MSVIHFYDPKEEFGFCSNFYKLSRGLLIDGEMWRDTEAYFQAMKFRGSNATPSSLSYSNIIRAADSPMKVKLLGNQRMPRGYQTSWVVNKRTDRRLLSEVIEEYKDLEIDPRWNENRLVVMRRAVFAKFDMYPELATKLLATPADTQFVEHTSRDSFWGDGGNGSGANHLGRIITEYRRLRA